MTVPTIHEVTRLQQADPEDRRRTSASLPIIGPRLREANASKKVQNWLNDFPKRLDVNSKPIENAAGAIADGIAAALFTLLLAITLLLDGELARQRRAPARARERRRADADRLGRLVYNVVGRYIAGTLFVAALAGVVDAHRRRSSLGVPLAPLIAVWVAITNPIPQVGGFLGGRSFVLLGSDPGRGRRRHRASSSSSCTSSSRTTCSSR